MKLDFELSGFDEGAEYGASDLNTTREKIEQYLSAGILFPEEIRNAERILRYSNKIDKASVRSRPAKETMPA